MDDFNRAIRFLKIMITMDVRNNSGNLPFHVSQDLCPKFLRSVYPRGGCQYYAPKQGLFPYGEI